MRQILFRAKKIPEGNWIMGYYSIRGTGSVMEYYPENYYGSVYISPIDSDTLCQFTGVSDIQGLHVFENDLIRFRDNIFSVFWDIDQCCFKAKDVHNPVHEIRLGACYSECKVIGNMFDDLNRVSSSDGD